MTNNCCYYHTDCKNGTEGTGCGVSCEGVKDYCYNNPPSTCICKPKLPCDSNPCKNGGTCTNNGETFTCKCTKNWYGDTCEKPLCNGVQCPENASCQSGICKCDACFEEKKSLFYSPASIKKISISSNKLSITYTGGDPKPVPSSDCIPKTCNPSCQGDYACICDPSTGNPSCKFKNSNITGAWVAFQDVKITSAWLTPEFKEFTKNPVPFSKFNMLIGFVALPQDISTNKIKYDIRNNSTFNKPNIIYRVICLGGGPYKWTVDDLSKTTINNIIKNVKATGWNGIQFDIEIINDNLKQDLLNAFRAVKEAGLYCSCTIYYEPGNQGGAVASIFSGPDVFNDCDSVVPQLYAGPGRPNGLSPSVKAFAECWYDKDKCTDVKYCADGSGLTTCPGPLSVGPHNLVWGIALDEGGINNQDMTGIPNVNNNNSPLIYWCLGGAWAPIGTS